MAVEPDQERIEIIKLRKDFIKLGEVLSAVDENGLFQENADDKSEYEKIFSVTYEGLNFLGENPDITKARESYHKAYHQLNRAIGAADPKWKFYYVFGAPFFLYLFAFLIGALLLWFFYSPVITTSTILWVPSWAYLWGLMGGILQGVWTLWHDVEFQRLRKHLIIWYIILPFLGTILGAIAYLIFLAGFIVSTGASQIASDAFVMLLCALAGFSSKWAVTLLVRVSELIQRRDER